MPYPFKMKPRSYQLQAWLASRDKEAFALLMEMGTGKTKVAIDTTAWLYDRGAVDSMIVFAPKGVYRNWQDEEVPKHMPDHVRYRMAAWASTPSREDKRLLELLEQRDSMGYLRVLLVNVEAMATKRAFDYVEKFMCGWGKAQCFARVPPGLVGPDGLAMDRHDRLYICDPGHGCVWIVDPHGVPLYRVQSEHGRMTTNCALAPDGRTLFITNPRPERSSPPISHDP